MSKRLFMLLSFFPKVKFYFTMIVIFLIALVTVILVTITVASFYLYRLFFQNPHEERKKAQETVQNIPDQPQIDLNLSPDQDHIIQRPVNSCVLTQMKSNLASLTEEQVTEMPGVGKIAAPLEDNTLYIMRNDSITIENTDPGDKGAAVFIAIGGKFEVEALKEKRKNPKFKDEFNNQLATTVTPEGFSKDPIPQDELAQLLTGAAFSQGGYSTDRAKSSFKTKDWFWQQDKYYNTEISFRSSRHFEEDGKKYVTLAAIVTASEGTTSNMERMANKEVSQLITVPPPENKNLLT